MLLQHLGLVLAVAAPNATATPARPPCQTVEVATVDPVNSGTAKAGDAFRFKTIGEVPANETHAAIPAGSTGYGIVMVAHHNGNRGKAGYMLIDARFVQLADGTHVPVQILPEPTRDTPMLQGSSANAPGYLGFIPFAGIMTGAYNTVHRGREIEVPPNTRFTLVVGDELALGTCTISVPSR
jgi:hypothetical protein